MIDSGIIHARLETPLHEIGRDANRSRTATDLAKGTREARRQIIHADRPSDEVILRHLEDGRCSMWLEANADDRDRAGGAQR
jgi:hypothetical protein